MITGLSPAFQILIYLRMCLSHDAGADPTIENVRDMKLQAPSIGKYVRQLIGDNSDVEKTIIATYINLIQQLLNAIGGKWIANLLYTTELSSLCHINY